jgi:methionine-rich copper-binding protein CopC
MIHFGKLAALAAIGMCAAGGAFAHAYPQTAIPAAGSTVQAAPHSVAIVFDDALEPRFSGIEVVNAKGARVDDGHSVVAADTPKRMSVGLKPLAAGTYKVKWHATDTDTHQTKGSYSFTVQP